MEIIEKKKDKYLYILSSQDHESQRIAKMLKDQKNAYVLWTDQKPPCSWEKLEQENKDALAKIMSPRLGFVVNIHYADEEFVNDQKNVLLSFEDYQKEKGSEYSNKYESKTVDLVKTVMYEPQLPHIIGVKFNSPEQDFRFKDNAECINRVDDGRPLTLEKSCCGQVAEQLGIDKMEVDAIAYFAAVYEAEGMDGLNRTFDEVQVPDPMAVSITDIVTEWDSHEQSHDAYDAPIIE